ncbi:MAG: hypothetical protein AAF630_00030 [Cyanobacteria bacterium P01_C01_bin.38]
MYLIGILSAVIIAATPVDTSKLPDEIDSTQTKTLINGHRLEIEIPTLETDIYSDGFSQQRRINPQPKIRRYL